MRKVTDKPWPTPTNVEEFAERLKRGEVKYRWPDAEEPIKLIL